MVIDKLFQRWVITCEDRKSLLTDRSFKRESLSVGMQSLPTLRDFDLGAQACGSFAIVVKPVPILHHTVTRFFAGATSSRMLSVSVRR